jgi:drug/metabolite transporter (DMT)-like permease
MNRAAFGQLLLLGALWGAAFMFLRIAAPEFGALALAGGRIAMAAVAMLLLLLIIRTPTHFKTHWKKYVVIGGVNTSLPFIAYSFAALYIPSGYSAIANSTTPIWVAIIGWVWLKEKLLWTKWLGIAFAFIGVIALVGLQPITATPLVIVSMLLCLGAAAMYGAANHLIKRYLFDVPGIAGATGMVWGSLVWLIAPALWAAPAAMPSTKAWFALAALALGCTALAYVLFFHLIKTVGPQRASSVAFLFPAFAAFWGWLFLDEPITINMWIGMALVFAGTALVSAPAERLSSIAKSATMLWELLLMPMLLAILPSRMRNSAIRRVVSNRTRFAADADATVSAALRYFPNTNVEEFTRDYRLCRLADLVDFWLYRLRSKRWPLENVDVKATADISGPALFVTYHYGGGWWIAWILSRRYLRANLLIRHPLHTNRWVDGILAAVGVYRNECFAGLIGNPLIWSDEAGAAMKLRACWKRGESAIALTDLPVSNVDRYRYAPLLSRSAYLPSSLFELAARSTVPVYVFIGEWNPQALQPTVRIELLAAAGSSAEEMVLRYATILNAELLRRPSAWHFWPAVEQFFKPPATSQRATLLDV